MFSCTCPYKSKGRDTEHRIRLTMSVKQASAKTMASDILFRCPESYCSFLIRIRGVLVFVFVFAKLKPVNDNERPQRPRMRARSPSSEPEYLSIWVADS